MAHTPTSTFIVILALATLHLSRRFNPQPLSILVFLSIAYSLITSSSSHTPSAHFVLLHSIVLFSSFLLLRILVFIRVNDWVIVHKATPCVYKSRRISTQRLLRKVQRSLPLCRVFGSANPGYRHPLLRHFGISQILRTVTRWVTVHKVTLVYT